MPFTFGGKPYNAIGSNDANNIFDSSNVVPNRDGTLLERNEFVISELVDKAQPVTFEVFPLPAIDEDGGRFIARVSVMDRNTGKVASANIDISAATVTLRKSTAGGAPGTAGVSQPAAATITKADGKIELNFDIVDTEWAVGDTGDLEVDAVAATVGGTTYYAGPLVWPIRIVEEKDVKATVDDIDTDLGEPTDAATDPSASGGTVFSKLRGQSSNIVRSGTAQAGAATTITLDAGASATDNIYDPSLVLIRSGTGAGQVRRIVQYNGTTKVAVVDKDWRTNPDATSQFFVLADPGGLSVNEGQAQAGTATTITLNAQANAVDDAYNGQIVHLRAGTGQDQMAVILDYNGTTKVATIGPSWTTTPDATSVYAVLPFAEAISAWMLALNATGVSVATNSLADQLYIGAGEQLRTFVAKTGATAVAAGKGLVDGIGHTGSAFLTSGLGNSIWQSEAVTAAADASVGSGAEENLLDKGADAGTPRYKLESALCNVASLGSNTSITFRLKAEINGTLTQIGNDEIRTATGAFDFMSKLAVTNIASRHIRVTVTGNNAANDGSVAATFVTSKGGN